MNKVIIINLKTREDRKEACLNALSEQGVPEDIIQVYHPITSNTLTEQNTLLNHMMHTHAIGFRDLLHREQMRYLSVTNSHLDALKIAAEGDGLALIMEDDFGLNCTWTNLVTSMQFLKATADTHGLFIAQLDGEWGWAYREIFREMPPPITTEIGDFYKDTPIWTCHAYVVNPKAAKQMKEKMIVDALTSFDCSSAFAPDVYQCRLLGSLSSWTIAQNQHIFVHLNKGSDH